MKKILLFLLAIIFAMQSWAQSTYVVADGTTMNSYLPVYGTWMDANQHNQIIYPATLVAPLTGATISKLTFHSAVESQTWGGATAVVSIAATTQSNFPTAAYASETLTQIYSGNVVVSGNIWELTFSTPFTFTGGNLLIDVVTTTAGSWSGESFYGITSTGGSIYQYGSSTPNIQDFIPKATFEYTGGSPVVLTSAATSINATSVTLNGSYYNMTTSNYGFQYMLDTETDWSTATLVPASTNPMSEVVSFLTPTTSYKFRAYAHDGTTNIYGDEFTFTTLALSATLPYFCDFENPTENNEWAFINGTQTNQWFVGDASYNPDVNNTVGGLNALYITNDAGLSWAYTLATSSTLSRVYAYRDFEVPIGTNELKLTIDWKANGNGYGDFLRVYWVPTDAVITAGSIPPGGLDISAALGTFYNNQNNNIHLQQATTWQTNEFVINTTQFPTLAGNTWRLLIHWRNENTSAALQPPATVDNISLIAVTCPTPNQLVATNPTVNSVDLEWTENGSAASWNIEYKKATETTWQTVAAYTNPYTVTGLDASSVYNFRVQSDCGSELSMFSPTVNKATACAAVTTLPWTEGFEAITATNELPPCWSATSLGSYTYTQISNYGSYNRNARTGIKAAYYRWSCNDRFYTVGVQLTAGVSYDFSFWYVTDGYSGWNTLQSAVYSAHNTDSLIQIINTINNPTNTTYQRSFGSFTPTDDGVYYFGVYCQATSGPMYLTLDDFKVDVSPSCLGPVNASAQNITPISADVVFSAGDPSTFNYQIYWKEASETVWNEDMIYYDTTYQLTSLTPNTIYNVKIAAECSDLTFSEATEFNFRSACAPFDVLPYTENFDTYTTGSSSFPPCWNRLSTYSTQPYVTTTNYSAPNSLYAPVSSGYYTYLIAPEPDATIMINQLQVKFYAKGASGENIQVGIMENISNPASFVPIQTIPVTASWAEYTAYLSNYTGTGNRIAFKMAPNNYVSYYIDNVIIDNAPTCLPVNDLTVSYISGSSAYVTWTPNGTPDYFTVEISETGTGIWNTFTSTDPNYILTGLTELTPYTVRVSPSCSGFDGLSDSVNFVTTCNVGGDLIIGTPDATTSTNGSYLPTQTYYNYSYSQQIFNADELGSIDSIFGVSFQYFITSALTRNLTIYLGHTSQSTFSSTSNYIHIDSLTQVYQGSVTLTNTGTNNWVSINFPVCFEYDGVSNLVVVVRDMTGSWENSSEKFRTHSVTGNKSVYYYQDSGPIDPASPSALSQGVVSFRNNVRFISPCEPATCIQPNVIVSNVGVHEADLIIIPGDNETSWEAEYKTSLETTWTPLGTVSVTNYNMSLLSSNTTYQVRFRTVCGSTDFSPWRTVTFTTECGTIDQLPFVENFDTYGSGSNIIPTCWLRHTSAGAYPYITTTPYNGPYSLYFYSSSSTYSMIVLPPLDPSLMLNTLQLTLFGRTGTAGNNLKVGVMTDPSDPSTFSLIGTLTPNSLNTYEELFISFANYTDTGRYVAIKSDNIDLALTNSMYIDSLKLDLLPSCVKPINIVFSAITTTTATASWDPSPTAISYEVVYGLPGVDPTTEIPIAVNDTFFEMTPLTATTLYHFYVRSVCGGGVYSDWTNLRTFTTVALAPVPYTEGFTSTSIPVGYNLTRFSVGSLTYVPGNPANNLYANLYSSYPTGVISTINIGPLQSNYELAFEYAYALWDGGGVVPAGSGNFIVAISTDWGTTYTNVDTVVNNGLAGYQNYSFDLSAYDTQIIKIKITGNWISDDYYLGIDNIYVGPAITCPFPTLLTAGNSTQTSSELSWTENGTATEWQIEYGPIGFTQGTGTFVSAMSNTAFVLTGLTATSCYDAYVRSVCGVGDTSIWSNKITFCSAQIPAQVPITFDFETPSGFQFANNPSGNNWYIGDATNNTTGGANAMYISNDNGVSNTYNITQNTVVWAYRDVEFPSSTADFTLTFDWTGVGEAGWDYMNVYIGNIVTPQALNSNYVITPPAGSTELAYQLADQTTWQTSTHTLPAATYAGQVKRIYFVWRNDSSYGDNPPVAVDNISITTSTPVCAIPTNLAVNGVTSSTATATWSAGGTETQWEIAYKPTASATWMTAFVSPVATYNLPSLLAATAYDVKVRAICGAGDTSAYTAIVNFTTLATSCPAPTNLAATAITTTGATITWTPGGSETAWELDYKLASASTWTTVNVSAPSHVLNTLVASTNYNVRVRAVCGSSNLSDYTAIVNFTTATPPCDIPTNVLVPTATITDQSAVVTWTAAAGQTQWQVEYKLVSSANWTTMAVSTSTTQPIQALQSNSTYEVRVKAICSATNESAFTTPVQFTTTGAVTYTITATATGPGTISPAGTVIVTAGADQTFTFTPTGTAQVVALLVDNQSTPYTNNEYTFTNVLANHTIAVDFAEGIDENSIANMVQLYPNPTNATIEIRLDETQLQVKECRVYDIYGKLLSIVPVYSDITKIDVTHFAAGVYFVRMNSDLGTITKKFVKK